jgi:hypothetical protein
VSSCLEPRRLEEALDGGVEHSDIVSPKKWPFVEPFMPFTGVEGSDDSDPESMEFRSEPSEPPFTPFTAWKILLEAPPGA